MHDTFILLSICMLLPTSIFRTEFMLGTEEKSSTNTETTHICYSTVHTYDILTSTFNTRFSVSQSVCLSKNSKWYCGSIKIFLEIRIA